MGEIKSALEIALEKTENVKGDRTLLEAAENKKTGQRIASKYLEDPENKENDLNRHIKAYSGKQQKQVKDGIFETLLNNITLPQDSPDEGRMHAIEKGMHTLISDKRFVSSIFQQIVQLLNQYVQNKQQIRDHLKQQFAQKLQQKEQEIASRLGTEVHLDPESDPEFAAYFKQHLSQLTGQFEEALGQGKAQLRKVYESRS